MKKLRIALISGGTSSERDISIASGEKVYAALDKSKYDIQRYDPKSDLKRLIENASHTDVALIILHGAYGEDGTVQGLLELLDIPYQGAGVLGSALSMNKVASKLMYDKQGIPTPPFVVLKKNDPVDPESIRKTLGLPVFIKPAVGGSSIGMSFVKEQQSLESAIRKAFEHDRTILIEAAVKGTEITCAVLGNDTLQALPVVEIIPNESHEFFDYEAKYSNTITQEICPARIPEALAQKAQRYAMLAHETLFVRGYSRTDMIVRGKEIFILETNTIPGMTENSLLPKAAKAAGISFQDLLDRLILLAIDEHKKDS